MGPFGPDASAFDPVWLDGFLLTWPQLPGG